MKMLKKFLTMMCMVLIVVLFGMNACAAEEPTCAKKVTLQFANTAAGSQLASMNAGIYLKNIASNAKLVSVKSGNKKINVSWNPGDNKISLFVKGKMSSNSYRTSKLKSGEKAKITLKVKQGGKTYTLQCQVTFKKQTNPVQAISIGGKTYKKFRTTSSGWKVSTEKKMPSSVKIKVMPKPGCKLVRLQAAYYKSGWHKDVTKILKNGSKVKTKMYGGTLRGIYVEYYQDSDLQGMITGKELKAAYGQKTAYINIEFK